ncbi:acyl-CoA thioesterase [Flavobacteriaceae bacterium Ap0902]|nr:acyl-CoA thioesterase [Flavobacteriaceae bacterium Ap0902]
MDKVKTPNDSLTIMTNIVLPNETNYLNNLFGGELLSRMDKACSISARRHAHTHRVVTASVNQVSFEVPIPVGSIVKIEAKVTRAFNSSMEIISDVWLEDPSTGQIIKTNQGIYTFVAVDANNKPIPIPKIVPQSQEEKDRYDAALRRKQLSLVIAKRMDPQDATELKALFAQKEEGSN